MAHELVNDLTQRVSFAYDETKGLPWHGLGTSVRGAMTATEAIEKAGLSFTVDKARNRFAPNDGPDLREQEAPSFTTYRTDTLQALGTVGERYTPMQNTDAFAFFDSFVDRSEAIYDTAGAVRNGARIFLSALLPERFRLESNPDDVIKSYLLLTNSHDGTGSITIGFQPIRVVCNNTLTAALAMLEYQHKKAKTSTTVSIRHTANLKEALTAASNVLGITTRLMLDLKAQADELARLPFNSSQLDKLSELLFPSEEGEPSTRTKNQREGFLSFHETGIGQELIRGTRWGAYNAVSGYFQHGASYHDDNSRFESLMDGRNRRRTSEALEYIVNA